MMRQLITLPNLLTILRMALVPVFVWLFMAGDAWFVSAIVVFTIAALTDYGDGFFARRSGQVSGLGILLDPIADKVLVTTTFFCFSYRGMLPWWFFGLILGRDLIITGVRWWWREQPASLAPSYLGKCKTVAQIVLIYVLFAWLLGERWLAQGGQDVMMIIVQVIMYLVAGVTAYTGVDYLCRYWALKRRRTPSMGSGQVTSERVTPAHVTRDDDQAAMMPPPVIKGRVKPARRVKMARRQDG